MNIIEKISEKIVAEILGENEKSPTAKKEDKWHGHYVIVRSYDAGVFCGTLVEFDRDRRIVELKNARNIDYWVGACGLSQIAEDGLSDPKCRLTKEVSKQEILNVIQILGCSANAEKSLREIVPWQK